MWTIPEVAFVGLTADAAKAPPHNLEMRRHVYIYVFIYIYIYIDIDIDIDR